MQAGCKQEYKYYCTQTEYPLSYPEYKKLFNEYLKLDKQYNKAGQLGLIEHSHYIHLLLQLKLVLACSIANPHRG